MKKLFTCFAMLALVLSAPGLALCDEVSLLNLTEYKDASSIAKNREQLVTVKISGKVSHVGPTDYHAVTPGVHVWMAEYPASKELNITSDDKGWWTIHVLKKKGTKLKFSLFYTKAGWITTKSNVMTVEDEDDTDIAIQYLDPFYFRLFVKPMIELMIQDLVPPESDTTLKNAMVVTVGKSWASIHDDRLPHGDPGATVNAIPGAIRPLYFDKNVKPNPALTCTSVDGGVAWLNVPTGTHVIQTSKKGVKYCDVQFVVAESDKKANPDSEAVLYIASPPDAVQGTNDSPPGKN